MLAAELGDAVTLAGECTGQHRTPGGAVQSFTWITARYARPIPGPARPDRRRPAYRPRNASRRSSGQVLITSSVVSHARWAMPTPNLSLARCGIACESLSIENLTP